jgi:hypothetical protein
VVLVDKHRQQWPSAQHISGHSQDTSRRKGWMACSPAEVRNPWANVGLSNIAAASKQEVFADEQSRFSSRPMA